MRLNSYAPTSSLKIKSCPGQAPASGKVTAEPRRTWSCAWAACAGSFRGEVVEAGEVPGSERMTTLPCNLGSYDSCPSLNLIRRINLQSRHPASCYTMSTGYPLNVCTCIKDKIPIEQIYSTSFALTLLLPQLIVVGVPGGIILAALWQEVNHTPLVLNGNIKTPTITN